MHLKEWFRYVREMLARLLAALHGIRSDLKSLSSSTKALSGGIMNITEAAAYLGISKRNLHELYDQGKIRRVDVSKRRYGFRKKELDRYIEENEHLAGQHPDKEADEHIKDEQ